MRLASDPSVELLFWAALTLGVLSRALAARTAPTALALLGASVAGACLMIAVFYRLEAGGAAPPAPAQPSRRTALLAFAPSAALRSGAAPATPTAPGKSREAPRRRRHQHHHHHHHRHHRRPGPIDPEIETAAGSTPTAPALTGGPPSPPAGGAAAVGALPGRSPGAYVMERPTAPRASAPGAPRPSHGSDPA